MTTTPEERQARFDDLWAESERQLGIEHKDGVPWHKADLPPWDHECWVQTRGWVRMFDLVERCACGAVRMGGPSHSWIEVNQTRTSRGEKPPVSLKPRRRLRSWLRR